MIGSYLLGTEYDSDAPWNQKRPTMVQCAACAGQGYHYYAYDFQADYEKECTPQTWLLLPDTEEEAIARHQHFIKGEKETCDVCDGEGEVEYDPDYEDDDEDY